MATLNTGIHFFEIEKNKKTLFLEDMHDYAILSNNDTLREIHYPTHQLAKLESDRMNALGIDGLKTETVGVPWRIYLVTWQEPKQRSYHDYTNEELFNFLINLYVIADDEEFHEWKYDRDRMIELCLGYEVT